MIFLRFWKSRKFKAEEKKIAKDHGIDPDKPSPVKMWEGDEVKPQAVRPVGGMGATKETPVMPPQKVGTVPLRVVRKRHKGFRLPSHTKCVNRGTLFGNPVKIYKDAIFIHAGHRRKKTDPWVYLMNGDIDTVLDIYEGLVTGYILSSTKYPDIALDKDIQHWVGHFQDLDVKKLRGWNLACFCKEDQKCHVDILIRLANGSV